MEKLINNSKKMFLSFKNKNYLAKTFLNTLLNGKKSWIKENIIII